MNPKLKGDQNYCGDPACQQARRTTWQRNKKATDKDYLESQQDDVRQWQKNKPVAQYMKSYRNNNPDYTKSNREKQRIRNRKRIRKTSDGMMLKVEPLSDKTQTPTMKSIEQNHAEKIVKMDALSLNFNPDNGIRLIVQKRFYDA